MFFTVSKSDKDTLPYTRKISTGWWLHTSGPWRSVGYKLGEHGGNFVEVDFELSSINFSLFKDFDLWQNNELGIAVSNCVPAQGTVLANDTVATVFSESAVQCKPFDWRNFFLAPKQSRTQVVQQIQQLLWSNLQQLSAVNPNGMQVVFTGGLDSSTLAFLCQYYGIEFSCLIDQSHRNFWPQLPFHNVQFVRPGTRPYCDQPNVYPSFYSSEHNFAVTGFYGDCNLLHNSTMYSQCETLPQFVKVHDLYCDAWDTTVPKFSNTNQILVAVRHQMMSTRFRQWFENFLVLDAYRDPRLAQTVMTLNWTDLIDQFGSAFVQKQIVKQLNPDWSKLLCDTKNNYNKFKTIDTQTTM